MANSGGKVSRAKLFYDKSRQQPGIMKNYDFVTFDEIQTIIFQDPPEMQAVLKSYLEAGNATVDNYRFLSECSTMLMGNIDLTSANLPRHNKYFAQLPESFRESALLDRFHGFIEAGICRDCSSIFKIAIPAAGTCRNRFAGVRTPFGILRNRFAGVRTPFGIFRNRFAGVQTPFGIL